MNNTVNITKQNIMNALEPQGCVYLWKDSSLIEVPQNSEELQPIKNLVKHAKLLIKNQ